MVSIDLLNLDSEIVSYSQNLYRAGLDLAMANSDRDVAKEDAEIIDSEIATSIRDTANKCNQKITESQIKLDILTTEEHVKAFNKANESIENASKVYAFVKSVEAKGKMLELLVQLSCRGIIDTNNSDTLKREVAKKRQERE